MTKCCCCCCGKLKMVEHHVDTRILHTNKYKSNNQIGNRTRHAVVVVSHHPCMVYGYPATTVFYVFIYIIIIRIKHIYMKNEADILRSFQQTKSNRAKSKVRTEQNKVIVRIKKKKIKSGYSAFLSLLLLLLCSFSNIWRWYNNEIYDDNNNSHNL